VNSKRQKVWPNRLWLQMRTISIWYDLWARYTWPRRNMMKQCIDTGKHLN
ncbi:unnamed protein product, partial [Symbiodinium microadriaticum]